MTLEIALVIAAVLVALGFWLGWKVVQRRRRGDDKPLAPVVVAEAPVVRVEAPVVTPVVTPVVVPTRPPMPPAAAPALAPTPAPAPALLDAPVPVTVIMAPRPSAPVIERVLAIEAASQAEWDTAVPLSLSVVQSASVVASLASGADTAFYAVGFDAGAAIAVGRGNQPFMRSLADAAGQKPAASGRWLDSTSAATLAATALAGLANERFLDALGDEVRDLKTVLATLSPKTAVPSDSRLKTLIQDLSRFAREARDNYASALGKAAFRERIDEAGERALGIWRELVEKTDAVRQQIEALTRIHRFGEAQVDKALALTRELIDAERWQEISARSLAAAHVLRVVMGELPASGGADPLASAAAALQAGLDQDRDLALHLSDCEKGARGDPYVGKAEFETNRAALRKLIARPAAERVTPALERLEAARTAEALDPPGAPRRRLLIRASGDACTMRWSGASAS